jgi:hypothetical protein
MEQDKHCERRRLAGDNSFAVESCECGAIHLTIGFVTLRMDPCAYREFAATIGIGLDQLGTPPGVAIH